MDDLRLLAMCFDPAITEHIDLGIDPDADNNAPPEEQKLTMRKLFLARNKVASRTELQVGNSTAKKAGQFQLPMDVLVGFLTKCFNDQALECPNLFSDDEHLISWQQLDASRRNITSFGLRPCYWAVRLRIHMLVALPKGLLCVFTSCTSLPAILTTAMCLPESRHPHQDSRALASCPGGLLVRLGQIQ